MKLTELFESESLIVDKDGLNESWIDNLVNELVDQGSSEDRVLDALGTVDDKDSSTVIAKALIQHGAFKGSLDKATNYVSLVRNKYKDSKSLKESVITKKQLKDVSKKEKIASRAEDLKPYLDKLRDETDLEKKKELAISMADHFALGGKEKFVANVKKAATRAEIDRIAYMAALAGEGMRVQK